MVPKEFLKENFDFDISVLGWLDRGRALYVQRETGAHCALEKNRL